MSRDHILTTRMPSGELCRLFHGIDCQLRCEAIAEFERLCKAIPWFRAWVQMLYPWGVAIKLAARIEASKPSLEAPCPGDY